MGRRWKGKDEEWSDAIGQFGRWVDIGWKVMYNGR